MPLFQGMQRIRKIIQRGAAEMRKTGLKFTWEAGSKNSNAIRVLKGKNISFKYDHFGNLTADFYGIGIFEKVDFEQIQSNEFDICIA